MNLDYAGHSGKLPHFRSTSATQGKTMTGIATLETQGIPTEKAFLDTSAYKQFLVARRALVSKRLNEFLGTA
jgi:hypothetical protein